MDQSNAGFAALVKEQDFSPRVGAANSPSTHRQRRGGCKRCRSPRTAGVQTERLSQEA